jgi:hypothetical protein
MEDVPSDKKPVADHPAVQGKWPERATTSSKGEQKPHAWGGAKHPAVQTKF